MVSSRGMKRCGSAMNSNTCHVLTQYKVRVRYIYIYMYMVKLESIGPLTYYICPGYGAYVVMEGYEQTWMGNKK